MSNIPQEILWFLGFMIVANLASIGSMLMAAFKLVWWASKVDSRLASVESSVDKFQTETKLSLDGFKDELQTFSGKLTPRRSHS